MEFFMKQNVVFLTKLRYDRGISEPSKNSWEYWCYKNNHKLFIHKGENPWNNLFDVFNILEENNIEYNKIFVVNGSSIVKWDCPNIFDLTDDRLGAWREMGNLGAIYKDIQDSGLDVDIFKYVNYGSFIINKNHKEFFEIASKTTHRNITETSFQTSVNSLLQSNSIEINMDISREYNLNHMMPYDWYSYNWQDGKDKTNFFIKYAYLWRFDDLDNNKYTDISSQIWNSIKNKYTSI
tara:strand:- start:368 stop:1078 length:711 start_codon:yes stop_codon:yes gene_type:complete